MNPTHPTQGALWPWMLLSLIIIVFDQSTKLLVAKMFELGDSVPVTSFFNLVRAHNPGAAFSFLSDQSGWQRWFFTLVGVLASVFIVWQLRVYRGQKLISLALALILGGALGNVIDRLAHGYVIDFLDFHGELFSVVFAGGHFPAFNVADACISAGAVCLIASEIARMRKQPPAALPMK